MSMTRINYLDNTKALLIILVVIGHAIQFNLIDYQDNFIFRFIYSFHMPLFLAISGYLVYRPQVVKNVIKKRSLQLLLPFLTWAIITPFLTTGAFDIERITQSLLYPDCGLWFLYHLFVYNVIMNISEQLSKEQRKYTQGFILVAFYICMFICMYIWRTKFNFTQLCWYFPFFITGYYIRKYESIWYKQEKVIMIVAGVIFIVGMPFWMMRDDPLFYKWLNLGALFAYLYRFAIMESGLLFFFILSKKYFNNSYSVLTSLGKNTLGIYALQFLVLGYLATLFSIENIWIMIVLISLICVPCCYYITLLIREVKYLRTALIGEK